MDVPVINQKNYSLFFYYLFFSLTGSTNPELVFDPVNPDDCGKYQCRVSNTFNTVWSNHANIQMQGVPTPSPAGRAYYGKILYYYDVSQAHTKKKKKN